MANGDITARRRVTRSCGCCQATGSSTRAIAAGVPIPRRSCASCGRCTRWCCRPRWRAQDVSTGFTWIHPRPILLHLRCPGCRARYRAPSDRRTVCRQVDQPPAGDSADHARSLGPRWTGAGRLCGALAAAAQSAAPLPARSADTGVAPARRGDVQPHISQPHASTL